MTEDRKPPTATQLEILKLVAEGDTLDEIALRLGKGKSSIKQTLYLMRHRLQVRTNAQAIDVLYKLGYFLTGREKLTSKETELKYDNIRLELFKHMPREVAENMVIQIRSIIGFPKSPWKEIPFSLVDPEYDQDSLETEEASEWDY